MKFQADFLNHCLFYLLLLILVFSALPLQTISSSAFPNNDSHVQNKFSKDPVGIALSSYHGKIYTADMSVGTNKFSMKAYIQTAFSDTWFSSTYCMGPSTQCGTNKFECTQTNGCMPTDSNAFVTRSGMQQMDINTHKGYLRATVATVPVDFASFSKQCMETTVGMLNYSSNIFMADSSFDGYLGLGRPDNLEVWDLQMPKQTPFQKLLTCMESFPSFYVSVKQQSGELTLGQPNSSLFQEPFYDYPVIGSLGWNLKAQTIKLGSYVMARMQPVLFDTGSSLIQVPYRYWTYIIETLRATKDMQTGHYLVKCPTHVRRYPALVFDFGGHDFPLEQSYYIADKEIKPGMCRLLLQQSWDYNWVLGVKWFMKYYTGFNFSSNTINIALGK